VVSLIGQRSRELERRAILFAALCPDPSAVCLYDRNRMPLTVIDGALSTHPRRPGTRYLFAECVLRRHRPVAWRGRPGGG
jgi:hypothetical protein